MSARVLVWLASVARDAELTPEAHQYFFTRYTQLAAIHRARGRFGKARELQAKADAHGASDDGPPYAAAMAMPRPRRFIQVNAVSRSRLGDPPGAA